MRGGLSIVFLAMFLLAMPLGAWAKPAIVLEVTSAREVVEKIDGKEVRKIVPTAKIEPGQTLIYTLKYRNDGDEKATDVAINNPIPDNTVYVVGSATGAGSEISFSIDGGKSFKQPTLLTYEITDSTGKAVKKMVAPAEYTHIQWLVREIAPGQRGEMLFQVKVK